MTGIVDSAAPKEQPLKINVHAGSNKTDIKEKADGMNQTKTGRIKKNKALN